MAVTLDIKTDPTKDEIFVKHYLRHHDAVQACAQARIFAHGYDMRDVAAYNLERPEIQQMLTDTTAASPQEITRDSIVTELQEIADRALGAGEFAPAITAKKTQAQLLGFLDQNVTVTLKHDVSSMTDAQLEKIIQGSRGKVIEGQFAETPKQLGLSAFGASPVQGLPD